LESKESEQCFILPAAEIQTDMSGSSERICISYKRMHIYAQYVSS